MTGGGYALRLRFSATLVGAVHALPEGGARRASRWTRARSTGPSEGEELQSPYVEDEQLDLAAWAHDAFALAAPAKVLCREDCAGLCPVCAADLNEAGPGAPTTRARRTRAGRSCAS